jgi:hypothetical protein
MIRYCNLRAGLVPVKVAFCTYEVETIQSVDMFFVYSRALGLDECVYAASPCKPQDIAAAHSAKPTWKPQDIAAAHSAESAGVYVLVETHTKV